MRRVEEIRKLSQACKLYHCPGVCNPADLLTRGVQADQLAESQLRWTGPDFLKSRELPCQEDAEELLLKEENVLQEEIKNPSNTTRIFLLPQKEMASSCRSLDKLMNCNDFSNLGRLYRVTCFICRFMRNVRYRMSRNDDALSKSRVLAAEEMNNAKNSWIQTVQSKVFVKEFQSITTGCA